MKKLITVVMDKKIWIAFLLLATQVGCEEFVTVGPPKTEVTSETVFTSDAAATAAMRGIYSLMMSNQSFTKGDIERYTGLSSDEFLDYSGYSDQQQFNIPSLQTVNGVVQRIFWTEAYKYINNANSMLEGLDRSSAISEKVRKQLEGEARFVRAFSYFYLVNLFGDVPYVTSTDFTENASLHRIDQGQVYDKIVEDLLIAQELLAQDFSFANNKRVQPNKGAATALLARVYLYRGEWADAAEQATSLIENTALYSLRQNLDEVFLANSTETIWQLMPVIPGTNAPQGELFILYDIPDYSFGGVALDEKFVDTIEPGDARMDNWIGSYDDGSTTYYFPFKYKVDYSSTLKEYATVLRLAEQYLIRAEARARLELIDEAQDDLNIIRHRAGLDDTAADDQALMLLAIEQERKIELVAEWGHRWLDLKRTGRAAAILSPLKIDWQDTDMLYPIPQSERLVNPLLTQNNGY